MADTMGSIFVPPEPRAWWRSRRKLARIALVTAVVVLAAGVVWFVTEVIRSCGSPWSGVYEVDGECVGITDGSFVFHPDFAEVQQKIAAENAWVRGEFAENSVPYVTVALLNPLTATRTSGLNESEILNQLEGAYTAQYRVNHSHDIEDPRPLIQLVLANEGSTQNQWRPVVEKLEEMTRQDNPLVAVVGMGLSVIQTRQAAEELSRHDIPMVGAIIAADELEHSRIRGLIRVTSTSQDYARSLRGYLNEHPDLRSAMVLYDSNSDSGADLFTNTLRNAFEREMKNLIRFPNLSFTGESMPADTNPATFGRTTANICAAAANGLQIVLYAGRRGDLGGFLSTMEGRPCRDRPLIVMVGTHPFAVLEEREQQLRDANLTVVFAGRTNARGWGHGVEGTPDYYPAFLNAFLDEGFDTGNLMDERAILTHDAVLAAVKAVRLAASEGPPSDVPTAREVRDKLMNLNGLDAVPGAGGTLSFSFRAQGAGNPVGKPVVIFQFPPATPGGSWEVGPPYVTR